MKTGPEIQCHPEEIANYPNIYLKQGEYYISDGRPAQVRTVLGSCVTVTMHCPILKIGAITHALLPFPLPGSEVLPNHWYRYVDSSIRQVFKKVMMKKVDKRQLEVKIFGGAHMLLPESKKPERKELNIGRRNVETALKTIQELGLNVTATDVGGPQGRKLLFFPHRGDVWVKKIDRSVNQKGGGDG